MTRIALGCLAVGLLTAAGTLTGQELKEKAKLSGHQRPVLSVAFSPDGKRMISGSADGTVQLWDGETGRQIEPCDFESCDFMDEVMKGQDAIQAVVFAPGSRKVGTSEWTRFAAIDANGTIRVFEMMGNYIIHPLMVIKGQGDVVAFAISPDGKTLAVSRVYMSDGKLHSSSVDLYTVTGKTSISDLAAEVRSIAYSPDGRFLATASLDGYVDLWDVSTAVPQKLDRFQTAEPRSLAFSPDGETLAVATGFDVRLLDVGSGALKNRQLLETGVAVNVQSVAFSADGNYLAFAQGNSVSLGMIICRHLEVMSTKAGHTGDVKAVTFSPDGKTLASASDDQTVILWLFAAEIVK